MSQDPIRLNGNNPTLYSYVDDVNKSIDYLGLSGSIFSEAWKVAAKNINNSGTTVLGHMSDMTNPNFESYVDKAIRKNASYFSIGDMWDDVAKNGNPWKLNQKFLDVIIDKGDRIILNVPRNQVRTGSYLSDELTYLEKNGYKWVNQWSLRKSCK